MSIRRHQALLDHGHGIHDVSPVLRDSISFDGARRSGCPFRDRHVALAATSSGRSRSPPSPRDRASMLLANNSGTETTDLLIPYAVLADAGVADVSIAAAGRAPVTLMPGLRDPSDTTSPRSRAANVAIVPAMHDPTAPALLDVVRRWTASSTLDRVDLRRRLGLAQRQRARRSPGHEPLVLDL
jgi:hypothetical protein